MDAGTARKQGFAVGDTVRVLLSGAAKRYGSSASSATATRPTSGRSRSRRSTSPPRSGSSTPGDRSTRCTCSGTPDVHRRRPATPDRARRSDRVTTCSPPIEADAAGRQAGTSVPRVLHDALLGFAAIGVVVGAFIIFNTFTILVAQRTRELGPVAGHGRHRRAGGPIRGARGVRRGLGRLGDRARSSGIGLGAGLLQLLRSSDSTCPTPRRSSSVARSWCRSSSAS